MKITEWAESGTALVAAIGLVFAGWQLLLMNRKARHDRRVAYEGVVVSWRALSRPNHPDTDGSATWVYEVTVHNPGSLPIDHVAVQWHVTTEVQRLHYDGVLDPATTSLDLETPVVAGGQSQTWKRSIRLPFANRSALNGTYATVTFTNIDGETITNRWPRIRQ